MRKMRSHAQLPRAQGNYADRTQDIPQGQTGGGVIRMSVMDKALEMRMLLAASDIFDERERQHAKKWES
jgi:hypothetical protein